MLSTEGNILRDFKKQKYGRLFASVMIDLVGMGSYVIPVLGEIGDLVFAPVSGLLIFWMYRKRVISGLTGGAIGVVEEILPWTDFVPTASLMWIYTYMTNGEDSLRLFAKDWKKKYQIASEA